jgi:hypothetical protein
VPNVNSNNLSVISGITNTVVATLPTSGCGADVAAYDSANGELYEPLAGCNVIEVIAGGSTLTFEETGLGSGTTWSAILDGTVSTSNSTTLSFTTLPGDHAYQVQPVAGYTVSPSSGSAAVGVDPYVVTVTYTLTPTSPAPTVQVSVSGYSEGFTIAVAVAATALGFAVATAVLVLRRRSSSSKPPG